MTKYGSVFLLVLLYHLTSFSQSLQADTTLVSAAQNSMVENYLHVMHEQIQLYNGSEYKDYKPQKNEHPYFISEDWILGNIEYNGNEFEHVSLLYNIYTDDIIIKNSSGSTKIKLVPAKINSFTVGGHYFVRLQEDSISIGFYDRLFDGQVKVYAKRIKEYKEAIYPDKVERDFIEKTNYFICKDNRYYLVKSKKSVFEVFDDKKNELKEFVKKSHLRFLKNRENAIVKMAEFYNMN